MHDCASLLKSAGLSVSHQRCLILEYVLNNKRHLAADEIYKALKPEHPSLSKMTVYNVLHALCQNGLIRDMRMDPNEIRYEGYLRNHGHFRCEKCSQMFDVEMPESAFSSDMLEGFNIKQIDLYYRGLCPECI